MNISRWIKKAIKQNDSIGNRGSGMEIRICRKYLHGTAGGRKALHCNDAAFDEESRARIAKHRRPEAEGFETIEQGHIWKPFVCPGVHGIVGMYVQSRANEVFAPEAEVQTAAKY